MPVDPPLSARCRDSAVSRDPYGGTVRCPFFFFSIYDERWEAYGGGGGTAPAIAIMREKELDILRRRARFARMMAGIVKSSWSRQFRAAPPCGPKMKRRMARTGLTVAACLLLFSCASEKFRGLGTRIGYFVPGSGDTTNYKGRVLWGLSYENYLTIAHGEWSWEAGLDFTFRDAESGDVATNLYVARFGVRNTLYELAIRDWDVYLAWGGQLSLPEKDGDNVTTMELTSGIGIRSNAQHWDARLTGQGVLGGGNIGLLWLVTVGTFF